MQKIVFILLVFSVILQAQDKTELNNIAGKSSINIESGNAQELGFKQTEMKSFVDKIKLLSELFSGCEEFKKPKGVDLEIISQFNNSNKFGDYKKYNEPITNNLTLFIYKYIKDENGEIYSNSSDGAYLSIDINTLSGKFTDLTMMSFYNLKKTDEYLPEYMIEDFFFEPKIINTFENYNVYENGTIVVSSKNISLFTPLTIEEYLNGLIKIHKFEIEKIKIYIEENITTLPIKIKAEELERNKAYKEAYAQLLKINKSEAENFKQEYLKAEKEIKIANEQNIKDTAEYRKNFANEIKNREEIIEKLNAELNSYSGESKKTQAFVGDMIGYDSSFLTNKENGRGLVKINRGAFEEGSSPEKIRFLILKTYPISINDLLTNTYNNEEITLSYLHKFLAKVKKADIEKLLK